MDKSKQIEISPEIRQLAYETFIEMKKTIEQLKQLHTLSLFARDSASVDELNETPYIYSEGLNKALEYVLKLDEYQWLADRLKKMGCSLSPNKHDLPKA